MSVCGNLELNIPFKTNSIWVKLSSVMTPAPTSPSRESVQTQSCLAHILIIRWRYLWNYQINHLMLFSFTDSLRQLLSLWCFILHYCCLWGIDLLHGPALCLGCEPFPFPFPFPFSSCHLKLLCIIVNDGLLVCFNLCLFFGLG